MLQSDALINLDPVEIQKYQQNRYPCFFVDCIEEAIPGKSARGYKNFTFNEWFFPAHFADEPNVPGFIQIETRGCSNRSIDTGFFNDISYFARE